MTLQELAELVGKMRDAQRGFFRTRDPDVLAESKRLEREVDKALDALEAELDSSAQKRLF